MLAMNSQDLRRQNSAKAHVTCNSFTSRVFQAAASATVVKLSSPRWRELGSCHLIPLALRAVGTARDSGTLVARRFVMKIHRWWIGILVVGGAIACGLALVFVAIGVIAGTTVEASGEATVAPSVTSVSQSVTSPADASLNSTSQSAAVQNASEQTYEGMVTCSRCGGRHPAKSHPNSRTVFAHLRSRRFRFHIGGWRGVVPVGRRSRNNQALCRPTRSGRRPGAGKYNSRVFYYTALNTDDYLTPFISRTDGGNKRSMALDTRSRTVYDVPTAVTFLLFGLTLGSFLSVILSSIKHRPTLVGSSPR